MKRNFVVLLVSALVFFSSAMAQRPSKADLSISVGSTLFFGDLGGANYIGRPLFFDLERSLIRPVLMLSYHYQASQRFAFRFQACYTGIGGDDKLIQPKAVFAPEWFRWYRNLNFHSKLWEVSAQAEFYFIKYQPGDLRQRWGPYILLGAGLFHFNPKTIDDNGNEVELRPLHTEGEGFTGSGVKEYNLFQPCFPMGVGIRYNLTSTFTFGIEYADRKTFTDYIDDVSTKYVSQSDFNAFFSNDPATADLAWTLSKRSNLIDPDGVYANITAPGQQRGDKKDLDHYIFPMQFAFSYVLGKKQHISRKSELKCMKWGGSGGEAPHKVRR
ncbi:MAG TPA: DUF6089 family protein [Chitinophagales bacterium]|nr:DUF6089 family protein [Chitinophagales bacterium]